MNFITEFKKGEEGRNKGLPVGIPSLNKDILGLQQGQLIVIAAPPKVGKTTLADFLFVLAPYMLGKEKNPKLDIEWIYYSFEISRIKKEFKIACFFFYKDHNIQSFEYEGKKYKITADYLMGKLLDDNEKTIKVLPEHKDILKIIYERRIVPLFGRYSDKGIKLEEGLINFIQERENPTGIRNYLLNYAAINGQFIKEKYKTKNDNGETETRTRIIGYKPNNPDKFVIIITDHMRKVKLERGFTLKQAVDKLAEYQVEIRDLCNYIFIDIIHTNRNLFDLDRIRHQGEFFYPTSEDIKDTGNLSEDANLIFTMFDANDDKYNIKRHFGLDLQDKNGNLLHPNYRSLHLVEARDVEGAPLHYQFDMFGNINWFQSIKK